MKKKIYYLAFTVLGGLIGFLTHAFIEFWIIRETVKNPSFLVKTSWDDLMLAHSIIMIAPTVLFGAAGYHFGKKFWRILYVEHRYSKKWGIKLKQNF